MTAILVPLDGSRFAESVVPLALSVARAMRAELHLVRVHEIIAVPIMDAITPMPVIDAALEAESRTGQSADLERSAADLRSSRGLTVHTALLDGNVSDAIVEYARTHAVSLIVSSTHGRTGFARAALGSVATELVRRSGVPTLLLHSADGQAPAAPASFEHVLVPLDGSAHAEVVLPPALSLLSGKRRVTLFRMVAPVTVDLAPSPMPMAVVDPVALEAEMAAAREYLEGVAATLRPQGFTVDVDVSANVSAPTSIASAIETARPDLVAIATHSRSGFARFVFGSVAESLVALVRTPVLVFHPPGR